MTQRERITETRGASKIGVYDTATEHTKVHHTTPIVGKPVDLVRWGPVFGGLFAALATLITLSLLGLAIGLTTFDANDPLGNLGLGAGIWSAISALLAFFVGGFVASNSAAFGGKTNGVFMGAMVWFVAIPSLVFLIGGGIGALTGTALQAASIPGIEQVIPEGTAPAPGTEGATQAQPTAPQTQQAADRAADTAWGVLLSLGLAAAAAILGGVVGARPRDEVAVNTTA